jgi:hypothetical protein
MLGRFILYNPELEVAERLSINGIDLLNERLTLHCRKRLPNLYMATRHATFTAPCIDIHRIFVMTSYLLGDLCPEGALVTKMF